MTVWLSALLPYLIERSDSCMKQLGTSRVTSRCQVTVPRSVRQLMKLNRGDLLVFVARRKEVVLKKGQVKITD